MLASDDDITLFAKTNFRNRETPFGIRRDDRRRHMYVIGKTGMGKTTFIENMVVQDILHGHGVCMVDPHGDSVEKILQYIPGNRINDVIYLNPADVDFPIAFNPLEAVDPKYKHLVASGLMGVFTKIWAGVWSPRMEYILQNTILALLDSPGNTMLGIARMYVDKAYRKKIVDNVKDPVVKSFWVDEFANYQDKFRTEAVAPIQNKVGQFLSNAIIRNIVGQTKSTIDLREIMDQKKILLLNLAKGRIGEDSSALLGAMIITKLQLAAMSRVDIPEEQRADYYLYVDEFQNFATESFANILSEARKYRLNLTVAHQYIGQLVQDRNTVVRDAIFGNVGTMIVFRVGADDAEFLEKEFDPTYLLNDLVNLAKYNIYLKLMINGVSSNPFSATTLPPISEPTGNVDKVIAVSRERYANRRADVEEKISRWLGAEFHAEAARRESESMDEEGVAENARFRQSARPSPSRPAAIRPSPARPAAPRVEPPRPAPRPIQATTPPKPLVATPPPIPALSRPAPVQPPQPPVNPPVAEESLPLPEDPVMEPPAAEAPFVLAPASTPAPAPVQPVRAAEPKREQPKPAPKPAHVERKAEGRHEDDRRGAKQQHPHPHRREADKRGDAKHAAKPKHENPVWDTVSRIATDRLAQSNNRANEALDNLTRSLRESVVKQPKQATQPIPAPKVTKPQLVTAKAPKFDPNGIVPHKPHPPKRKEPVHHRQPEPEPEMDLGHLSDPGLPDHIHPDNPAESPHHNIQQLISRHGELKPGESVKFD